MTKCYQCGKQSDKTISVHVMEDAEGWVLVPICKECAGKYEHTADAWEDKYEKEGE